MASDSPGRLINLILSLHAPFSRLSVFTCWILMPFTGVTICSCSPDASRPHCTGYVSILPIWAHATAARKIAQLTHLCRRSQLFFARFSLRAGKGNRPGFALFHYNLPFSTVGLVFGVVSFLVCMCVCVWNLAFSSCHVVGENLGKREANWYLRQRGIIENH